MIDLHTVATANGQKVSIMLEEVGETYRVHPIDLVQGDHKSAAYLAINPVGKVPAIVDHDPPGQAGAPLKLGETAAILLYLAEKHGALMPSAAVARALVYQWVSVVSADIGPAFSARFILDGYVQPRPEAAVTYYTQDAHRYLKVMEAELGRGEWLAGADYTLADVIAYPVAATSVQRLPGGLEPYPAIRAWAARVGARPAVQRGMAVPKETAA